MTDQYLKVRDHPTLYRDPVSKAIVVVDPAARQQYINQKNIMEKTVNTTDHLREEINSMKTEMQEIKTLLMSISNQISKG